MSVLQGRHPEHVRAERETQQAMAARRAKVDAEAAAEDAAEKKRLVRKLVVGGVLVLAVGTASSLAYSHHKRLEAVEGTLGPLAAPYLSQGFTLVVGGVMDGSGRVTTRANEPMCYVALATPGAQVVVQHGDANLTAERSAAFCTCGPETVTVSAPESADNAGVRLLSAPAQSVGGSLALPFVEPRPEIIADPEECANERLDAWLAGRPASKPPSALGSDTDARGRALGDNGFSAIAAVSKGAPFAILPDATESCWIALSTEPRDVLSLRLPKDSRPIAHVTSPIAWCVRQPHGQTLWREGEGEVVVALSPAQRVGGSLGLREAVQRAGVGTIDVWVPPDDLGWDATAMMRAAGVAQSEITVTADTKSVGIARFVAISTTSGNLIADPSDASLHFCTPPLGPGTHASVCAESKSLGWRSLGGVGNAGIAVGPLPFWMQVFSTVADSDALKSEAALFALSRRLVSQGFEPTTLEGVTELEGGIEVLGRAGDTGIVAVGMAPEWPWIYPYTDGPAWKIDGDPRVVALDGGVRVKLTSAPAPTAPRETRHTVVFRRAKPRP